MADESPKFAIVNLQFVMRAIRQVVPSARASCRAISKNSLSICLKTMGKLVINEIGFVKSHSKQIGAWKVYNERKRYTSRECQYYKYDLYLPSLMV